ncbi:galactose-1-phosphate uridylyltransferase [Kribbella flavida DSM 17836]|uniref:Galactose-1-phosphate uridylyltransferase n=1 Tax=Kribbella flavida (strain DSM 17836 / JCM 10339 / NBRC 14399) TaxID=479435 RepID=D2Q491_KRIFD|nr:galactose-1-phosphate uridylyltransferase [Kribbella flavida]ADB30405.1 galactose-1-phosphate uridylyltransferase [Kribbella flavida DSM 17836]
MQTPRGARRTDTKLSDGRDLIYYDPADAPVRVPPADTRGLDAPKPQVQLRTDPLTGDVITYATHRNTRTYLPPADQCPLCPTKPGNPTEIPDHDYNVAVFANRFPSFAGPGRAEVVCFTSDHSKSFTDLSQGQARLVVETWADRVAELSARPDVEYIFPFENRGREIGVTLSHPHGQIYAYPFLPPRIRTLLARAREHRDATGGNLFADVLAAERTQGTRVVAENPTWTAFVPEAARWPVEVHLYPHRQVADIAELTDAERDDFAELYLNVLRRFDGLYGEPLPYIAAWHAAPVRVDRELGYLHLELLSIRRAADKIKYLAGSESGMGAFISDTRPEDVAETLRKAGS